MKLNMELYEKNLKLVIMVLNYLTIIEITLMALILMLFFELFEGLVEIMCVIC